MTAAVPTRTLLRCRQCISAITRTAPASGELAGEQTQQRGLAAAVRPDQRQTLRSDDGERHAVDVLRGAAAGEHAVERRERVTDAARVGDGGAGA
jgi:hypothetical protein